MPLAAMKCAINKTLNEYQGMLAPDRPNKQAHKFGNSSSFEPCVACNFALYGAGLSLKGWISRKGYLRLWSHMHGLIDRKGFECSGMLHLRCPGVNHDFGWPNTPDRKFCNRLFRPKFGKVKESWQKCVAQQFFFYTEINCRLLLL